MMTASSFQAALAHLLVNREARLALATCPEKIQAQFGLSDDELRLLVTTNVARIELNAWTVSAKRLDFLKRALPTTTRFFGATCHDRRLVNFVETCPPLHSPEQPNRLVAEGERFVSYLDETRPEGVPPYLADLARYELLRLKLLLNAEASAAAERTAQYLQRHRASQRSDIEALEREPFQLGAHISLERFPVDILALFEAFRQSMLPTEAAPRPICIALQKHYQRGTLASYRIGPFVYTMLELWEVPRRLAEIRAMLSKLIPGADELQSSTEAAACFALSEGFLVPVGRLEAC